MSLVNESLVKVLAFNVPHVLVVSEYFYFTSNGDFIIQICDESEN